MTIATCTTRPKIDLRNMTRMQRAEYVRENPGKRHRLRLIECGKCRRAMFLTARVASLVSRQTGVPAPDHAVPAIRRAALPDVLGGGATHTGRQAVFAEDREGWHLRRRVPLGGLLMDAANLPSVVREGELNLPGLTIRVLHLNNGQRVIPAEDWNRVMDWLASTPTDADVAKLAALEDSK